MLGALMRRVGCANRSLRALQASRCSVTCWLRCCLRAKRSPLRGSTSRRASRGAPHTLPLNPKHAGPALNLGVAMQESGDPDAAMQFYGTAYRLRPQMFGSIAMALTSAAHGRLWLDEAALRHALTR